MGFVQVWWGWVEIPVGNDGTRDHDRVLEAVRLSLSCPRVQAWNEYKLRKKTDW